ncbi:uncharacterized protein N7479_005643 [Penicillium vulpinum]|nr:uncharacterized protein N7479_005643 [Penicillium vulpinum]KAJ5958493.1 hypothetical protein N7479_005643 [Penicillium vulpinum]
MALVDKDVLDAPQAIETVDRTPPYWSEPEHTSLGAIENRTSFRNKRSNSCKWLPDYASPLSHSITSEDCNVLHERGAFDVPDPRSRARILNAYFQFVHPALPILSSEEFLMVLDTSYNDSRGVSFLLFQAVIFAATAFQPVDSLVLEGFKDRREARKARFDRINLLYSYGCEEDRIAILQSVLLMTYWDDTSDQDQGAWHFVGVARSIFDSIKAKPTDSEQKFIQQQPGLWNRLSWSCYIRDRLVCLQTRRPFQFYESDFSSDTLQPSDFEAGPLPTGCCLGDDGSHPAIRDPSMRSVLSQISITLVQCCKCITRILECQYTRFREPNQFTNIFMATLSPRRPHAMNVEVLLRDIELEEWLATLPDALRWYPSDPFFQISKHGEVFLHFRAMLSGIYGLACSALHRPQLLVTASSLPELTELSKRRLCYSADTITQTYIYLRSRCLTHLFPDSQVTALETAIITHLDNLESTESLTRQSAMEFFQSCAQGLQQLTETYASAASVLASLDVAIRNTQISLEIEDTQLHDSLESNRPSHKRIMMAQRKSNSHQETFASSPTIADQLDNLNPPQMSKMLCSHFMMTPAERSLLQDLASTEGGSLDLYSEEDSESDEDSYTFSGPVHNPYQSQLSSTQALPQTETIFSDPQRHPSIDIYEHENIDDDWNVLRSLLL